MLNGLFESPCQGRDSFFPDRTQSASPVKEPLASAASESKPSSALAGRSVAPIMAAMQKPAVSKFEAQPTTELAAVAAAAPEVPAPEAVVNTAPRQVEAAPATPAPVVMLGAAPLASASKDTADAQPVVAGSLPKTAQAQTSSTPAVPAAATSPLRPNSFFAQAVSCPLPTPPGCQIQVAFCSSFR